MASPPRGPSGARAKGRRRPVPEPTPEPTTAHELACTKPASAVRPAGPAPAAETGPAGAGTGTESEWLKVEEVASILRLPVSTTYELVRSGRIPSVKLGKHRRIRREVLSGLGR